MNCRGSGAEPFPLRMILALVNQAEQAGPTRAEDGQELPAETARREALHQKVVEARRRVPEAG